MTNYKQPAAQADHTENHLEMAGRWYMVNKMGMATLCTDKDGAEKEAADAQRFWPHMGPHRAVQLVEAARENTAPQPSPASQAGACEPLIRQMRYALALPCDRWNATQSRIVREAIDAADAWLEGKK